ncbi:MAG TPA: CapA family protein [Nitrososphaeraceae archaeon]|nr:CapA family protein [Nitrososphaeraceae archaeon]
MSIKKMTVIIFNIGITIFCILLLFYYSPQLINNNNVAFASPSSSDKTVSIMAVGDSIGYNINHEDLTNLETIIHQNTDIFIFNLEGLLAKDSSFLDNNHSIEDCKGFPSYQSTFVTDSTFVDYLKLASITIANLANNHVFDCGPKGIEETKRVLMEKDILSVGAGQNLKEACEPLVIQSNKGLRIVFVSYNFILEDLVSAQTNRAGGASIDNCNHDYDKIRLQNQADLIIASIHLGIWSPNVSKEQIDVVQYLFDSGVDIVIGHSPHIPQAILKTTTTDEGGKEEEKLAFFNLGNFILRPDYNMPSEAHITIVPELDIDTESNLMSVTIYPVTIDNEGIPHLEERWNNGIINKVTKTSAEGFGTSINIRENIGQISVKLQHLE